MHSNSPSAPVRRSAPRRTGVLTKRVRQCAYREAHCTHGADVACKHMSAPPAQSHNLEQVMR